MCDIEWNPKLFQIPDYLFDAEGIGVTPSEKPECPVIVFVNSKSGGQLGSALLTTYRSILNKNQVFDLHEVAPDKVLGKFYQNLERLKPIDTFSSIIEERLRLIVAGGDGTAGWLLGVISDLKLLNPPPIATSPLGTGNNLPFSFGWGKRNPGTDELSVKAFLRQVQKAKKMSTDSWHIVMKMKYSSGPPTLGSLPHSLHPFRHTSPSNTPDMDRYLAFRGGFWNYFSMGADAQVSHAFHSARKDHPEKFKNQLHNQGTYAKIGLKHGLFNASKFQSSSQNIAEIVKVSIMKKQGSWENLPVPQSIRSIICLNLPSFSGGLNPWGTPRASNKKWTPSFVDDGLLEIVGFKDIWQGLSLLAPQGHGTRLAQAHGIKFEFHKGADHTYMRLDGEPWEQPFPDDVVIEISHFGQVNILATDNCRSVGKDSLKQPIDHESNSSSHHTLEDDSDDSEENSEERRKFGAAETFKMLENIDISHLS